jgi:uncharacterized DUF497 family protein
VNRDPFLPGFRRGLYGWSHLVRWSRSVRDIEIDWDDGTLDHLWRHRVEPYEVEEVLAQRCLWQRGREGRYYAYGQTYDGRYLFAVLARLPSRLYRCVTARPMTQAERRHFQRMTRG